MPKKILKSLLLFLSIATMIILLAGFVFYPDTSYAAVTLVQKGENSGLVSVSVTWPSATTAGNILIGVISGCATDLPTSSGPVGWSLAKGQGFISGTFNCELDIWYKPNAPSETTTGDFSLGASTVFIELIAVEYSGIVTSSPLDQTASTSGSGTSASTGTTGTTTQADELLIGGIGTGGDVTFSSPTNSFTIQETINKTAFLDRIVSATGTYSTGATLSVSTDWAGAIATFKAVVSSGGGGGGGGGKFWGIVNPGKLVITKKTQGGDGTFGFIIVGSGYGATFSITTQNGEGSHTLTLSSGLYYVTEVVPRDWIKTEDTCNAVGVMSNQTTNCFVTNVKGLSNKGAILVEVKTLGGDGKFDFKTSGKDYQPFSITTVNGLGSNTQINLSPGFYSAIETVPVGWIKTEDSCSSIIVVPGITAKCSVTNVKNGTIILTKKSVGENGTFYFTTTGGDGLPTNISVTTVKETGTKTFANIAPGKYTISEIIPFGWVLVSSYCSVETPKSFNVPAGGAVTCTFNNTKLNPTPTINSIEPEFKTEGDLGFILTVNGTNFISSSSVNFNGLPRITTFVSSTKLTSAIISSDLTKSGTFDITVTNPAPGGGKSNAVSFIVEKKPAQPGDFGGGEESPGGVGGGGGGGGEGIGGGAGEFIITIIQGISEAVLTVVEDLKKIIEIPVISTVTKIISTIGAVAGTIAVGSVVISSLPSFYEVVWSIIRFIGGILTAFGLKKRIRHWGRVYDSVTKQPLDPAQVVLQNIKSAGVASAITDIDGRYGFLVGPGQYKIVAKKTNYYFPSEKLKGKTQDELYSDLYFGEPIEVSKAGEVITKNIPLDPLKFDWNEFAKKNKNFMKFYSKWDLILRQIYDFSFVVGFVVAIISFFLAPRPYNTIILIVYLVLLLLRVLGLRPKSVGYVVEKKTGIPLSFAILRIMTSPSNVQIGQKIADEYGRYYCLVPKGKYYLKIEKKNPDGSYSLVHTSPVIDAGRSGIIKKKFEV